jgi:hypothetical protein
MLVHQPLIVYIYSETRLSFKTLQYHQYAMGTITNINSLALVLGFSLQSVKYLFVRRTATGSSSVVITKNELVVGVLPSPIKLATFFLCLLALE